jgi:GAF domain-containing protein
VPKPNAFEPAPSREAIANDEEHHLLSEARNRMRVSLTWRSELLDATLGVAAIVGAPLAVVVIATRSPPRVDLGAYLVFAAAWLVIGLRFLPRLPFKLRAGLTIAAIYGSGLPTILRSGFSISSAAILLAAIVLAIILLGRGSAVLLLIVTAIVLVALGVAAQGGHFVAHPVDSDPRIPRNWIRVAIGFDLVAATLMAAIAYAVRSIEMNYADVSSALALLTSEQRRRTGLESERQRSEGDWRRSAHALTALGENQGIEDGDARAAFRALAETGARGMGIERCSVWLFDEARSELRCRDLYERTAGRHSSGMALGASAAPAYFAALESERSIAAHHAQTDPRTRELRSTYLDPLHISSMLDAPIRHQNRVVGVLCNEHVGDAIIWSDAQRSFAGSLADFAARILSAADRTAKALALRTSTDEIAEMLNVLRLQLPAIPPGCVGAAAVEPLGVVDGLIDRVHRLSLNLHLPPLDEVGLVAALSAHLAAQSATSGVKIDLDTSRFAGSAAPATEIACLWIVQEAVANVLGHANAHAVSVRLERQDGQLRISVEDDGRGMDPERLVDAAALGHGRIVRMRERARALGGNFAINSVQGAGTVIVATLPSKAPREA